MFPRRSQVPVLDRQLMLTGIACAVIAALTILPSHRIGWTAALFLPLGLLAAAVLLMRPVWCVGVAIGSALLLQGHGFDLLTFQSHLYDTVYKRLTPLDGLVVLALLSVGLDMLRSSRPLRLPRELIIFDIFMLLALISGIFVGRAGGGHLKSLVLDENVFFYLIALPVAVYNLDLDERRMRTLIGVLFAIAVATALLGIVEVAAGKGVELESRGTRFTFYEATPNWLVMIAMFGIFGAVLARLRPPLWMIASAPFLLIETVLSYRRSFWIATAAGLVLVVLLALSPLGRKLLVPTALLLAGAIWFLGSLNFQSQSPLVKRAVSLSPSQLSSNVQDRYRLDERANVLADLERHPIAGLGLAGAWEASTRPLSVEHEGGREYVHFAALYWWMKLGILGLISYGLLLAMMALLSWKVWRHGAGSAVRLFGLASLCGTAGLLVAETTATFVAAELRFTVVLAAQIGLLACFARPAGAQQERVGDAAEAPGAPAQLIAPPA